MRSLPLLVCALLGLATPALGGEAPSRTSAAADDETTRAPEEARREALFDLGFEALVNGDLTLAERAFGEAALLPGDAAQRAVAASFVERVQRLRARRTRPPSEPEENAPTPTSDGGRAERIALLGTTTVLGLGLYGWTLPNMLGIDSANSSRAFVGVYMLTSATAFIAPYFLLRNQPVTSGQANLGFYGGTRGIWMGVLLGAILAGNLDPDVRPQAWSASMLLGSVAGLVGGYQLAGRAALTAGQARTMAAVGDFGLLFGFGTGFLLRFNETSDERFPCFSDFSGPCSPPNSDAHARKMAAAGLLGGGLGLAGGYLLAQQRDNSWGDGEVLRGSTALGVWLAAGVINIADIDPGLDNRAFTGTLMAGGALGLLAGDRLVQNTNFTPGQSLLVDLSMISGGLLGAGISYLVRSGGGDKPVVTASAVGATLGFGLAYWGFRGTAETPVTRALSRLTGSGVAVIPTMGTRGERGLALGGLF